MSHYGLVHVGSMKLKGHQISMYGARMQVNLYVSLRSRTCR